MSDLRSHFGQKRLRVTLKQLEVFVAVAKERSTRAAADAVARSQSAASSALAELESNMGTALFDRAGRRLILNESGAKLLPIALSLIDQALELEQAFEDISGSSLVVAASMTIGEHILPEILARWQTKHPRTTVRLLISNTAAVLDAIEQFDVDVGFIEGQQTRSGLHLQHWFNDEMVVVAGASHPFAHRVVSMSDLRFASWAMREVGSGTREAAERWLLESLGQINIEYELGTPQAVAAFVASSTALACLPRHAVARNVKGGELVILNTEMPRASRRLSIVTHGSRKLGATSQTFIDHCQKCSALAPASGLKDDESWRPARLIASKHSTDEGVEGVMWL